MYIPSIIKRPKLTPINFKIDFMLFIIFSFLVSGAGVSSSVVSFSSTVSSIICSLGLVLEGNDDGGCCCLVLFSQFFFGFSYAV